MANIYLRKSTLNDLDQIMKIINEAKSLLKKDGSSQWQNGYPNRNILEKDIKNHINWVLMVNNEIAGVVTLATTQEDNYSEIDGEWKHNGGYTTIHRVAISSKFHGMHLSSFMFSNLITISKLKDFNDIRLDTSPLNKRMQHLANKFGFHKRGIIKAIDVLDSNSNRYAYELNL